MRTRDNGAGDGGHQHGRRARVIRRIQVALFCLVVLLVGFRVWEREHSGGSSSVLFGLMAASALSVGVLERYRANAVPPAPTKADTRPT
ncbi:hypothetical protein ACWGKW_12355 [Streptomyces sp. NPDC054766]